MARLPRGAARVVGVAAALGLAAGLLLAWSEPAGAVTVTDETTFRAAWSNAAETQIDLATDVTLTCAGGGAAQRNSTTALTLDGHGHSITQTCADSTVLDNPFGVSMFRNVTITGGNAPNAVGAGLNQSMTVEVHRQRRHRPRRHQPVAPAAPVRAVVRFTG